MKRKPVLLKAIQEEAQEKERQNQEKIKAQEKERQDQEIKGKQERERINKELKLAEQREKLTESSNNISDDIVRSTPQPGTPGTVNKSNPIKAIFNALFKLLTLIVNLIISLLESLQWIVVSVIITIAVLIILKYSGININTIIDKGKDILISK